MRPALLNLLTALWLVLCVAVCVLWVRSYYVSDHWIWVDHPPAAAPRLRLGVLVHSGQFSLNWSQSALQPADRYSGRFVHETRRPPVQFWWKRYDGTTGFWNRRGFATFDTDVHGPAWFLALAFAGATVLCARPRRWLALRRGSRGVCSHCGYDLRATPDKCPECGTPAKAPA
jgi:hypothetical protein